MTTYFMQEEPGRSGVSIMAIKGTDVIPVAHVYSENGINPLLDGKAWTKNLVSKLNGAPIDNLDLGPHQFYYERLPNMRGISLHCRYGCRGVSESGIVLTVSDKSSASAEGHALMERLSPEFMKDLCDAIELARPSAELPPPAAPGKPPSFNI